MLCYSCNVSGVFSSAKNYFRTSAPELKQEGAMLLEEWLNLESSFGELGDVSLVRVKLPKKFKKRRLVKAEDGLVGYTYQLYVLISLFDLRSPPHPEKEQKEKAICHFLVLLVLIFYVICES